MNKQLFLVLLAVCLVSGQSYFVKRDAPAATAEPTLPKDIKNTLDSITKQMEEAMKNNLYADELNNLNKLNEEMKQMFDSVKKSIEASKQ